MLHRREPHLLDDYYRVAVDEGFDEIIVFTPEDVDLSKQKILAYVHQNGKWIRREQSYPIIGYDVGYYHDNKTIQKVNKIKRHIPFMGAALGNKSSIQARLSRSPIIKNHLIPTLIAHTPSSLKKMLKKYQTIILKPVQGMGGKDIIKISSHDQRFLMQYEDQQQILTKDGLLGRLSRIYKGRKVLIQKWIDIRDKQERVYDIRILMQKNNEGKWNLTGMGLRLGTDNKITSNLKSGGQALEAYPFLEEQYGEELAKKLYQDITSLSYHTATFLDNKAKKALVELGLDMAIDRDKQIWIIEVNNKPGKTIFKHIQNEVADKQSIRLPIQYAKHLLFKKSR